MSFTKNEKKMLLGFFVCLIILIVGAIVCESRKGNTTLPDIEKMTLKYAKACTSKNVCNDDVILLTGQIIPDSGNTIPAKLQESVSSNPNIRRVCFDSPGGDNVSAQAIGAKIALLKLDTCFASKYLESNGIVIQPTLCNSACPLILLAGQNRYSYGNGLQVGLHSSNEHWDICGCRIWEGENKNAIDDFRDLIQRYSTINPDRIEYNSDHLRLLSLAYTVSHNTIGMLDSQRGLDEFHFYTEILP